MTLVETIGKVTDWLNSDVCSQISLKKPDDRKNNEGYKVEYVKPTAFPLYVPGKDALPPSVPAPIPSVCVQLIEGKDDLVKKKRQIDIRLCLACWNPGKHGDEILYPRDSADSLGGYSYYKILKGIEQTYARNMEGWKDSLNFADLVLRELENTEFINDLRIMKESGIKYGLFKEDGAIQDYYPYWHNWISFTLEAGVVNRIPEAYADFL